MRGWRVHNGQPRGLEKPLDGWVIAGVVAAMVVALVTVVKAWHEFRVPIQRWWALRVESALEELHRLTLNASAIQARKERLRELVGLRPLLLRIVRNPPRDWNRPFELEGMKTEAVLELRRLGIPTFLDDAETGERTGEALERFFEKVSRGLRPAVPPAGRKGLA